MMLTDINEFLLTVAKKQKIMIIMILLVVFISAKSLFDLSVEWEKKTVAALNTNYEVRAFP